MSYQPFRVDVDNPLETSFDLREVEMAFWYRAARAADKRYRGEEPPDPELFVRAARVLGFDFVAFDFGRFPDGRPVIFEANPYPFINPMPGGILWHERRLDEYTLRMYGAIGRYLQSRLGTRRAEAGK